MPSVANASASPATPTPRDVAIEAAAASRPPPLAPAYSEVTDLDLLVSRIGEAEDRGDGANYDALLLSEFIGPAVSTRPAHESVPPPAPILPVPAPRAPNVPVIGTIQIQRRRTLKDGRTKLKLALMDTAVDKCGICLTQFKSGDIAQLGSVCRHAFHERCLGRWLVHNQTCPMCRVPLERL
ncbi:hypothetical protein DXG03_002277 [Asterophora parasitica]|uniref:RING-type domain-containing protein n=1 Tax=Asterophora parasitica TaxID=117018 RepID=A0A9P7G919_9AGAR|nr:hypothetical protein DXG03_002277 [Asterophora parasitica]